MNGLVEDLRQRRARLRESLIALELALSSPSGGVPGQWSGYVRGALGDVAADLDRHIQITEGPDGLYADLAEVAPRLSDAADRLANEHAEMKQRLETMLARLDLDQPDPEEVRDLGTGLLGMFVRHRQRGADLVYEAYEVDIGGDT